ncbi:hypothetical protein ABZ946_24025 [Streptomyces sp. NPDC046324]|uniref:hypothetical protein n=1 Tax=Streptomyces sp. NPDC046324 TaxID=3154915 RepID=UPI0033F512A5
MSTVIRLASFRDAVAASVHVRIGDIATGDVGYVGAPTQPTVVGTHLLTALIRFSRVDGYLVCDPYV